MKRNDAEPIGKLIQQFLRQESLESPLNEQRLLDAWPQILGPASSIRPLFKMNGPQDDTPAVEMAVGATPASPHTSSTRRSTWRASAPLSPVLAVGSVRRACSGGGAPALRASNQLETAC